MRWKSRRQVARLHARIESARRKSRKKKSCHPGRLWPLGANPRDPREEFEALYSGNFDRLLKWFYRGLNNLDDIFYKDSPLFALSPKHSILSS